MPTPAEGASAADGGDLENRPGGVPPGADIRTEGRDRGAPGPRVLERSRSALTGGEGHEAAGRVRPHGDMHPEAGLNDLDAERHQKRAHDAGGWLPPMNRCWFA